MPSLREIKGRIGSVNSTLKITSAMKMVAAAKLHRAQNAISGMRPYENRMQEMMQQLLGRVENPHHVFLDSREVKSVAVVAVSSNSSLCGVFNANVVKAVNEVLESYEAEGITDVTVIPVGRKIFDAMRKAGRVKEDLYSSIADRPKYEAISRLAKSLMADFSSGKYDRIELVYNHFKSTSSQEMKRETFLPMCLDGYCYDSKKDRSDFIFEPDKGPLLSEMLPEVLMLKMYSVILDAQAAEHAARTVAMQTATDNGNDLLRELKLEYNRGRQQKITNEILDIIGGSMT